LAASGLRLQGNLERQSGKFDQAEQGLAMTRVRRNAPASFNPY
jgi:hypothetical protein